MGWRFEQISHHEMRPTTSFGAFDAARPGKGWFASQNDCNAILVGLAMGIEDSERLELLEYQ